MPHEPTLRASTPLHGGARDGVAGAVAGIVTYYAIQELDPAAQEAIGALVSTTITGASIGLFSMARKWVRRLQEGR